MKALYLLADIPGVFAPLVARIAERVKREGVEPVFASTSRFYERFHHLDLASLGHAEYLSDYLSGAARDRGESDAVNYWASYPTFVRQKYFFGRHLNSWAVYPRVTRFFRNLFESHPEIGFVWSEAPSSSFLCLAHAEASRRGVRYYGYMSARLPRSFNVFLDLYGERMLEAKSGAAGGDRNGAPDYMRNPLAALEDHSVLGMAGRRAHRFLDAARAGGELSLESGKTLTYQLRAYWRLLERKWRYLRVRMARGVFDENPLDPNRVNVLLPLQYRPEASTSVLARNYGDDLEVIRNVAFSLPPGATLLVKEHAAAVGLRRLAFYRDVAELPSTRLLAPAFPLRERLAEFDAVVTLTSTAGFEALSVGVPVLLLGRTFYGGLPGVTRVDSLAHLESLVRSLRKTTKNRSDEALQWYRRYCFPGSFNYLDPSVLEPDNLELLAAPLLRSRLADGAA